MLSEQSLNMIDIVARLGSFTAAANELNKVPSAVSYAVKQIESDVGVTLFERHHRSVSLTEPGKHFLQRSRELLREMSAIKHETQRVANGWKPELAIALDNIVRADRISSLISDFYRKFDDIELIIRIEVYNGVWESLATGRSDVAIGATSAIPVGGTYQYRDMKGVDWAFVVSKSHPLAKIDRPLTDDELRQYPAICLEDTSREIPKRTTWLLDNQRRLVVPDWIRAINCFASGLGVGYVPCHLAETFIRSGLLVRKTLVNPKIASACCLAWNPDNMSPALEWVLDYLGDTEKLYQEWLS
ncbi:LysR family transcriptional regulator [Shewanella sp. WXL01]|uniref:LysR family transcriptional regulator n=1 Tax=Shewanella maritima TaxID=2520507 RepID=A0A411PCX8_9GAMM|nr:MULTISPECIES: DNA-binding transcriptional activator PunR [Shewanella]NKF50601.1 LysR family transcriptional regulator [Shewanella sp. WXL01]QBF81409.1 LysR family transcriptional regulator [Shewanella maritima]